MEHTPWQVKLAYVFQIIVLSPTLILSKEGLLRPSVKMINTEF